MSTPVITEISGAEEWEAALAIRRAVFVDEQGGPPEDEPDRWDNEARHFLVLDGSLPVGTARLYSPAAGISKLGRIAILPSHRGLGWGALLLDHLLATCMALPVEEVILDAQVDAVGFYLRRGFRPQGESFLEAGIIHQRLRISHAELRRAMRGDGLGEREIHTRDAAGK